MAWKREKKWTWGRNFKNEQDYCFLTGGFCFNATMEQDTSEPDAVPIDQVEAKGS